MPDLSAQAMAEKLLAGSFQRGAAGTQAITDPIADTPMVVTLDQLRPYDGNPRVARNPMHDDIKASIRARGLDEPPPITRRPRETHFIIRNGGNTRLTILNELWTETKDDRFFRLTCLFRPWSTRGEIVLLTGHLAENELRGELTFIEKALAVEKARQLYEQETGVSLSQRDLSRRLTADGYPISQSHISRMQETVTYLLPAIPTILYAGLGRGLAERLTTLRRSSMRAWGRYAPRAKPTADFDSIFSDVLASFDHDTAFSVERVRDELIGQFAQVLTTDYDTLALQIADAEMRQRVLTPESPTVADLPWPQEGASGNRAQSVRPSDATRAVDAPSALLVQSTQDPVLTPSATSLSTSNTAEISSRTDAKNSPPDRLEAHIVSPAESTPRLEAIQRTIAQATGDAVESFHDKVLRAIPVQVGGLHPISDVWYIEAAIDSPDRLRAHILQLATEIAHEADLTHRIEAAGDGIGFFCTAGGSGTGDSQSLIARAVLSVLSALSAGSEAWKPAVEGIRLVDDLAPLLLGTRSKQRVSRSATRLSDAGVVKLFRLIRLARRLVELEQNDRLSTNLQS